MIGLLPCAGKAERLYGLPKYLLPIPDGFMMQRHIEHMRLAGCEHVLIGTNCDNGELVDEYAKPHRGMTYLAHNYKTMSETVLEAKVLAGHENVLFGMPDTYVTDPFMYARLAAALNHYPVAAACFRKTPAEYSSAGMVDFDKDEIITSVIDKPKETNLEWSWIALGWTPAFWPYIRPEDAHVGFALARADEAGVRCKAVLFEGRSYDCGSLDGYYSMLKAVMK